MKENPLLLTEGLDRCSTLHEFDRPYFDGYMFGYVRPTKKHRNAIDKEYQVLSTFTGLTRTGRYVSFEENLRKTEERQKQYLEEQRKYKNRERARRRKERQRRIEVEHVPEAPVSKESKWWMAEWDRQESYRIEQERIRQEKRAEEIWEAREKARELREKEERERIYQVNEKQYLARFEEDTPEKQRRDQNEKRWNKELERQKGMSRAELIEERKKQTVQKCKTAPKTASALNDLQQPKMTVMYLRETYAKKFADNGYEEPFLKRQEEFKNLSQNRIDMLLRRVWPERYE